jgi:glutaminase
LQTASAGQSAGVDKQYQSAVDAAYAKYKDLKEGKNADYIPALAQVPSDLFGVSLVSVDGQQFHKGEVDVPVSIQSISKVFALARVIEDEGPKAIQDKVGVDATGEVFNSITAVERLRGKEINPCVNPGALATTSLVRGKTYEEKWNAIIGIHNDMAGRQRQRCFCAGDRRCRFSGAQQRERVIGECIGIVGRQRRRAGKGGERAGGIARLRPLLPEAGQSCRVIPHKLALS